MTTIFVLFFHNRSNKIFGLSVIRWCNKIHSVYSKLKRVADWHTNGRKCDFNSRSIYYCDNYRVSGALEKLEHETILQDRASDR